jgi:hypothetical protein
MCVCERERERKGRATAGAVDPQRARLVRVEE